MPPQLLFCDDACSSGREYNVHWPRGIIRNLPMTVAGHQPQTLRPQPRPSHSQSICIGWNLNEAPPGVGLRKIMRGGSRSWFLCLLAPSRQQRSGVTPEKNNRVPNTALYRLLLGPLSVGDSVQLAAIIRQLRTTAIKVS